MGYFWAVKRRKEQMKENDLWRKEKEIKEQLTANTNATKHLK